MDKFTRMIMGARKADVDSIRELKNYIYEESGVANKSLRALEKSGYTEFAYGHAMNFLNTEYQSIKFPQAVAKRPTSDLIKQALYLHNFLALPTRTVRGAKIARQHMMEGIKRLNELGYNVPTDKEKLDRIFKVLSRTGVSIDGDFKYVVWDDINEAFENGYTEEDIEQNLLRWQSDELIYPELVSLFKSRR